MCLRFLAVPVFTLTVAAVAPAISLANPVVASGNFIQQRALGPIKWQTGLPESAPRLYSPRELQIDFVHNNVFMGGIAESERLVLDGESSVLSLRYRQRLNACWQINANGSWLSHSRGRFDKPVDQWHQVFGLPDAMRGEWPANQLEYTYENGNGEQALAAAHSGPGDVHLQVQRYISCTPASSIVRFGLKLPLGEPETFSGNAAYDTFVDVQSGWQGSQRFSRWQWAGSIGLLHSVDSKLLAAQKSLTGFGVLGLNMTLTAHSQILAQLDWHTPLFNSELPELGNTAVQFSLGYRHNTRRGSVWELSFSEDAAIDTAPDIAVRLAWLFRFGASN